MSTRRSGSPFRVAVEVSYVVLVIALTLFAASDPNDIRAGAWISALALCLPTIIGVLPVLYIAAAFAWNITGADNGGTTWPVTATYVVVLALTALLNVALVRFLADRRRAVQGTVP
jgi:hypothetical protein